MIGGKNKETYLATVRGVTNIEELLHPPRCAGDRTTMREALETGLSAVSALSGVTNATECQCRDTGVEQRVADGGTATGGAPENAVDLLLVAEGV